MRQGIYHPLPNFRTNESYECLKNELEDIILEVTQLTTISVGSEEYEVEYFLGEDWKFLAIVTGIYAELYNQVCSAISLVCKCSWLHCGIILTRF